MSTASLREAREKDIPRLVALMSEFYTEAGFRLGEETASRTFAAIIGDRALGRVWLIEDDGDPAGYVVLTVSFSMEYGGLRGFVDDFFVRSPHRRRGLGGAALAKVREVAESLGIRALVVEVGASNAEARSVYERSGYRDDGRVLLAAPLAAPVHDE